MDGGLGGSRQGQPCILKIVGKVQKKKGKKKQSEPPQGAPEAEARSAGSEGAPCGGSLCFFFPFFFWTSPTIFRIQKGASQPAFLGFFGFF